MKRKKYVGNLLLLITALIWGSAFVAQSEGMDYIGPLTFNTARSFIGFLVLLPVMLILRKKAAAGPILRDRISLRGGLWCGIVLALASALQQAGIAETTVGKAGFLTALYIVIVPLLGAFFGKKIPRIILLCVALATAGFYFLCIKEGFSISRGDLLCFACAFVFSAHILTIDHFMEKGADGVLMSDVQFLIAGLLSLPPALLWESPSASALFSARWNVLYAGALSSGVAYTLQIVGQKHTEPAVASLIMSLESVFAALFGWLILHEALSFRELAGCALVFAAVILAQLPAEEHAPS